MKSLGRTGAGLASDKVHDGSKLANLVGKSSFSVALVSYPTIWPCHASDEIVSVWPWWKDLHAFWRELPNYNPIGVENSMPGEDHAGAAAALFDPEEPSEGGAEDDSQDDETHTTSGDEQVQVQDVGDSKDSDENEGGEDIDELDSDRDVCEFLPCLDHFFLTPFDIRRSHLPHCS